MKISIIYLIFVTLLISCNQEKRLLEYSQEKADQFVEMYADEFLKDTELLRFIYHPRAQFTFVQDSLNSYRIFPSENEIGLICFSDSFQLTEPLNNSPLKLSKGRCILKQDSILTKLSYDSTTFKILDFKQNPEEYFNEHKKRLEKYGVFAFSESKKKSFVKVNFSVQYYLIYSKNVKNDINQYEILKSYNDNCYFMKMKRQMDLG